MTHTPRNWLLLIATSGLALWAATTARSQESDAKALRLQGLVPGGARSSVTESWGALTFGVTNFDGAARDARVTDFYPERPEEQYGRDIWIHPRSTLWSCLLVGPAPKQQAELGR